MKKEQKNRRGIVRMLKWVGLALISLVVLAVIVVTAARLSTYFSNHITSKEGVDEGIYVSLGGQEQYLLIRGEDVSNPVIIWLHGGPTSPDTYVNYSFQKYLVDDYTIVNWDQRGCGRTYFRNRDTDPENRTASFEQAQTDLDELVEYVSSRFGTEKIIIVGHSYGTMLGSYYTLNNPEKVAAYIGVGQVASIESDIYSYEDALKKAEEKGDDTSAMVEAYNKYMQDSSLVNMMNLRKLVVPYHPVEKDANTIWLGVSSPYMGLADLRWFMKQAGSMDSYVKLNQQLFDYIKTADVSDYGLEYQVPVGFITGSCDWTTPVKGAQDYYDMITAPQKEIHIMEGCGHAPQYAEPKEFCELLEGMLKEYLK